MNGHPARDNDSARLRINRLQLVDATRTRLFRHDIRQKSEIKLENILFRERQVLRVKVISVDEKRGRIGLSLKDVPQEGQRKEARA